MNGLRKTDMNVLPIVIILLGVLVLIVNIFRSINNGKVAETKTGRSKILITAVDAIFLSLGIGLLLKKLSVFFIIAIIFLLTIATITLHYSAYLLTKSLFEKKTKRKIASCMWMINMLLDSLKILSRSADEQVRWLNNKKFHTDELALDFDDGYQTLHHNFAYQKAYGISREQMRILDAIDAALDKISGRENPEYWTPEDLKEKPEWEQIRKLAQEALTLFQPLPSQEEGTCTEKNCSRQ